MYLIAQHFRHLTPIVKRLFPFVVSLLLLPLTATAQSNKRKVFLLAGQSNREGHARIETFDSIGGICKVKLGERTIEFPDKTRRNSHAEQRSYYNL
jgi:hypothetical protein